MDELEIAFDTKEKFEYFIKYVFLEYKGELVKDKEKEYYILKNRPNFIRNRFITIFSPFISQPSYNYSFKLN